MVVVVVVDIVFVSQLFNILVGVDIGRHFNHFQSLIGGFGKVVFFVDNFDDLFVVVVVLLIIIIIMITARPSTAAGPHDVLLFSYVYYMILFDYTDSSFLS